MQAISHVRIHYIYVESYAIKIGKPTTVLIIRK